MLQILLKTYKYKAINNNLLLSAHAVSTENRNQSSEFFIKKFKLILCTQNIIKDSNFNKHFYSLILKKWVFLINKNRFYFIVYNYFVFKILYQTCALIDFLVKAKKNVLFITDNDLESIVSFRDLNFMSLNKDISHLSHLYGSVHFWYRESGDLFNINTIDTKLLRKKFDLVVVLCNNYSHFSPKNFLGLSKFTIGFADLQTNPDLFNYFIPIVKNKFFSAQILKEFIFFKLNQ